MSVWKHLPPLDVNHCQIDELIDTYEVEREIAQLIVDNRPHKRPEDLFRLIAKAGTGRDVALIMGNSRGTFPVTSLELYIQSQQETINNEVVLSISESTINIKRISISGNSGTEFISAEIRDGTLDHSTIKVVSLSPWEFYWVLPDGRKAIAQQLHGKECEQAASVWKIVGKTSQGPVTGRARNAISLLSQILSVFRDLVQPLQIVNGKCQTNGCTVVPDFDFAECCNSHDICYCQGCDDDDKAKCDEELRKCIRRKGHPILADVYFEGVDALGDSHFNYDCPILDSTSEPDIIDTTDQPVTRNCHVIVTVISVKYGGNNIGNDWSYWFSVDGQSTRLLHDQKHNHGATRSFGVVVYDKVLDGRCGDAFRLNLAANAKEHDAFSDDNGSHSTNFRVQCTPGVIREYRDSFTVKVKEGSWFWKKIARLRFAFKITTQCE